MAGKNKNSSDRERVLNDTLPTNIEAERSILGAILLDNYCYFQVAMEIRADDFAYDSHRRIYRTILELDANSQPFDYVTIAELLSRNKELEAIGGVAYLTSLTDGLPRISNVSHYVNIVRDDARRRKLIFAANAMTQRAMDRSESVEDVLAQAQKDVLDIAASSARIRPYKVDEYSGEMFKSMREVADSEKTKELLGLSFGFEPLDTETSGVMPGELVVIGGYSGDGKSLLTAQMVYTNACAGKKVLVFTQEMTKQQYLRRMVPAATQGNLPGYMLRDLRGLDITLRGELDIAEKKLEKLPLWTVDSSVLDVAQMGAIARSMIRREKIDMIVVDFLQLLSAQGMDDYQRVTWAAGMTRQIAKDEGVVCVDVSQITPTEKGKKLPPTMYMLRSSGDIAQSAHIIAFVFRPEKGGLYTNKDQIRLAKMREGSGRVPFPAELDRRMLQFVPRAEDEKQDDEKPAAKTKGKGKAAAAGEVPSTASLYGGNV